MSEFNNDETVEVNTSGAEGSSEEVVVESENGAESIVNETPTEGGEGEGETEVKTEESQDEEFIEQDGKKLIPKERFDQVNERMKKAEEAYQFVEALKTDPNALKQLLEEHGLGQKTPAQADATPTITPVAKFIATAVPEESRQHYEGFVSALEQHFDAKYGGLLEQAMTPIKSHIGMTIINGMKQKAPDFDKYAPGIHKRMAANPNLSVEDAYKLESFDDRFNAGKKVALQKTEQHKQKLNKTPINKNPNSNTNPAPKKAGDLREAFERAWNKQGA